MIFGGCTETSEKNPSREKRIISLAPHITEIIYALNAQDQLIAVTDYCLFPKSATLKEKIGGLLDPNIEKMVALKPTHLFGLPSHEKLAQELTKFDLTVTMMPNENVDDVLMSIMKIGRIIDREQQSARLIKNIKTILDSLQNNKINKNISAVLIIGREKGTLKNITVAGSNTYIDEIWGIVGGENTYSDLPTRYGAINLESLLMRDPELIIQFDMKRESGIYRADLTSEWDFLKNLQAVQKENIFVIGGNHTFIPGPRMVLLAKDFGKIIDRFKSN